MFSWEDLDREPSSLVLKANQLLGYICKKNCLIDNKKFQQQSKVT